MILAFNQYLCLMFTRFISLLMCLLFINSPLSYSLTLHYCRDKLVSIDSIYDYHKGCGMESNPLGTGQVKFTTDCCSDVFLGIAEYADHIVKTAQCLGFVKQSLGVSNYWNIFLTPFVESINSSTFARPPNILHAIYLIYQQWILYE